jgi:FixJ family two-component response regulator
MSAFGGKADAQIPGCLIADVNMHALTGTELYRHRCLLAALTGRRAR